VFHISDVPDDQVRAQFLRLGFLDGDVECRHRVTNGPDTELAVGNPVATQITIEPR
jgi:ferrous iron transport protein A